MKINFKEARESRGLTLREAADLSGYSIATINGLELSDDGSVRLRERLLEIYGLQNPPQSGADIIREAYEKKNYTEAMAAVQKLKNDAVALEEILQRAFGLKKPDKPLHYGRRPGSVEDDDPEAAKITRDLDA
jgi:transcriptional regulator with XRE-family HTH domain